jgi:hypothetical protein
MIIYDGMLKKGKVSFIRFKNERGNVIEIPLEDTSAARIAMSLSKISTAESVIHERNNEELEG